MLKQISVFLANQPGILAKLTKTLMDHKINIRALTVAETADYGILRMLVNKTEEAVKILKEENYLVSITEVIAVEIPDEPGALYKLADLLGKNQVNIEYVYSTLFKNEAIIVLRIDDLEKAVSTLRGTSFKLIESQEF